MRLATLRDRSFRDVALTTMLVVQCFALFVAAPLGALGYRTLGSIADLLLLAYVLLIVLVSPSRTIAIIALSISSCGLADGILRVLFPSPSTILLAHAISIVAFIVLGYVVARVVFEAGPVNTHRVLGAIVLYLNVALLFILPINPFARSLANLESIIGQLYPATLLARLVAQHLQEQRR